MQGGELRFFGNTAETIQHYTRSHEDLAKQPLAERQDRQGKGQLRFERLELLDEQGNNLGFGMTGKPLRLRLHYRQTAPLQALRRGRIALSFVRQGQILTILSSEQVRPEGLDCHSAQGYYDFYLPKLNLPFGRYQTILFAEFDREVQDWIENAALVDIEDGDFYGSGRNYPQGFEGKIILSEFGVESSERP